MPVEGPSTSEPRRHEDNDRLLQDFRAVLADAGEPELQAFLEDLHAADVADCLEALSEEERSRVLFLLPPRTAAEAIVLLEESVRSEMLDGFQPEQVSAVLTELPADDAVDVLDEMDAERADEIVEHLPEENRAAVEPLRQYDEDSAGGIMNTAFVAVPISAKVGDAINMIRKLTEEQRVELYYVYSVDHDGKLVGVVPPVRLVANPSEMPLEKLLLDDLFTANVADDQEEVKNKFDKYDVVALPVVDDDFRMVGVITHDDVLEIAEEEAEEDILHMAGTDADEFSRQSVLYAASVRARWLLPCLGGTFAASLIAIFFEQQMDKNIFALLIPFLIPIAAMGGNAGVQISTVIVRALATGDVLASQFRRAAYREMRIAGILGVGAGIFAAAGAFIVMNSGMSIGAGHGSGDGSTADMTASTVRLAASVGSAMMLAILLSGSMGLTLPYLFRRLGIDPAIATGPLITTVNDAVSATLYLSIALFLVG